ncbi:trypsin CFT-1-like [Pectinophora gossypiella]|uniref:trypsin CFT-1-like n=1 Tax=Pectinophora gossypiella TaxID=13191 RepID=UPI00214E3363|nr:trypsin CFT-1-like [Pectinophora gossypiella]
MFVRFGFLLISLGAVSAGPYIPQRIVGGALTTISSYPYASSMLYSWNIGTYSQSCGGSLLNTRTVMSAAHCYYGGSSSQWRIRLGSSWANSGGYVYTVNSIIIHPNYNPNTIDNDVALLRTPTITYVPNLVQPASIAGANYNLADNQAVYAIGWGATAVNGPGSEQLRHVQIWSINQATCKARYAELGWTVTDNMLCSGWLDVGGRDQCQGDSGGPLIHNNVIVGICSWGNQCALPRYPGVNTRVSKFSNWIVANA